MYQFDVVTLFPEMFSAVLDHGVTGRAVRERHVGFRSWNPRHFSTDKHHTVDDRPYGGGPGMVMMYEPVVEAIARAKNQQPQASVVYLSPQGRRMTQQAVNRFAEADGLVLICGRYEGIDERIIQSHIDEEWSIGDYVISGGELAAMVVIDSISRLLPDVLGHEDSAAQDSFIDGLLDYPHYTRPERVNAQAVPDVLLGGNHEQIRRWRLKQALGKTWLVRPDLLDEKQLDKEQQQLLEEFIADYEQ